MHHVVVDQRLKGAFKTGRRHLWIGVSDKDEENISRIQAMVCKGTVIYSVDTFLNISPLFSLNVHIKSSDFHTNQAPLSKQTGLFFYKKYISKRLCNE